jgi:hypothetical protein
MIMHALFFVYFYLFRCADHQDMRHIDQLPAILKLITSDFYRYSKYILYGILHYKKWLL